MTEVGLNEDQADAILDAVSSMSPDEQERDGEGEGECLDVDTNAGML